MSRCVGNRRGIGEKFTVKNEIQIIEVEIKRKFELKREKLDKEMSYVNVQEFILEYSNIDKWDRDVII